MGDKRLSARLVKSAALLAACPGHKINAAPDADNTAVNAFYRLIEAPAESEITPANILAPHGERSIRRMRGQRTVLAIQDGTDLNFSRRPGCGGLQIIGRNRATATSLGLHMHATLAAAATGLPLGVLALGFDPVKPLSKEEEKRRRTQRWLEAFNGAADAAGEIGRRTRVICVCDREADMFELFDVQRRRRRVELLVRAKHDRVLEKGKPKLFATMSGGTPDGLIDVEIEGLTARAKSSRKKARPAREKRLAACELRFRRVALPATDAVPGADPVAVHGVHVKERAPPKDEEPVQWFLLTTVKVKTAQDAAEVVGF